MSEKKSVNKKLTLTKITVKSGIRAGSQPITTALTCNQKTWNCPSRLC